MASFNGKYLPPISDEKLFEKFSADLWQKCHPGSSVALNGRSGQRQHGVDSLLQAGNRLIGVQSKAARELETDVLDSEVDKAKGHDPALTHFVLLTTAPHDAKLVAHAAAISAQHREAGLFEVSYHGWEDLLRMLEDHPDLARKYFPEFVDADGTPSEDEPKRFVLPIDSDLNISLSDEDLELFCTEAAWALKHEHGTILRAQHEVEQEIAARLAGIEAQEPLDAAKRKERSQLRDMLAPYARRLRQVEAAIPILLLDENARAPWLAGGGCWEATAAVLRQLVRAIFKPAMRPPHSVALKIRPEEFPQIVGWIDLQGEDADAFRARCPEFNANFFEGGVIDLGDELGMRYALPEGIAAVVRYAAGHEVPIEPLQKQGATAIFNWALYPS